MNNRRDKGRKGSSLTGETLVASPNSGKQSLLKTVCLLATASVSLLMAACGNAGGSGSGVSQIDLEPQFLPIEGLTLKQSDELAKSFLGPTKDINAALEEVDSDFLSLDTPAGTEITSVRRFVDASELFLAQGTTVKFDVAATGDLEDIFESLNVLAPSGWEKREVENTDFDFVAMFSRSELFSLSDTVEVGIDGSDNGSEVSIRYTRNIDAAQRDLVLKNFAAWASGFGFAESSVVASASLEVNGSYIEREVEVMQYYLDEPSNQQLDDALDQVVDNTPGLEKADHETQLRFGENEIDISGDLIENQTGYLNWNRFSGVHSEELGVPVDFSIEIMNQYEGGR